ncbi:FGGY-family carbohydrate kinase [Clostridium saccharoperbutylacetonicum]|uniref:FGGY-family carbohydrate kinase n=1 Tax=Clostridium saccharoperbutylacetonicum TaxID=36745 RepID=UPI0009838F24|nr:glycerol kinase [Clostridium saccharoperbutylacetonicum]AQR97275.1 glycerol kinase [Clostridium saccharoperbutylacetonicum]NSB33157.1 glycerol kinase [Clostridium saccharoperbutylacetonicum]
MAKYIIGIDQSTQGTKALLFNEEGTLVQRTDLSHEQIVNDKGWVSHNPMEIYHNTIEVVKNLIKKAKVNKNEIVGVGISNQRETTVAWDKETGIPIDNAIVWQCSRATEICERLEEVEKAELVRQKTGMNLSPYFPASKIWWLLEHVEGAKLKAEADKLYFGTMDSWLIYKLTKGSAYKTDYSNASRTQLFNIMELKWDEEVCELFGINPNNLAEICESNSNFGETDFEGFLDKAIPIHGVLGDSHGALFGQGCLEPGRIKTTYGTGSSIMMNIGEKPVLSTHGVVTSLAWGMNGKVNYVLEGNINYTGAVITWLKDDLKLIASPTETEQVAFEANSDDKLYLIPAFTGLGAPYWDSKATGTISGITRTTGRAEIVRAGLEAIAYQITDVVKAMSKDSGIVIEELCVDGGPTGNKYLMQFQSDILQMAVQVPDSEELSGIGVAYAAGMALGVYDKTIFNKIKKIKFESKMDTNLRNKKYQGWLAAVQNILVKK